MTQNPESNVLTQRGTFNIVDVSQLPVAQPKEDEMIIITPEGGGLMFTRYKIS